MKEQLVDEFVAISSLTFIRLNSVNPKNDLYEFVEIDNIYNFGICDDVDIEELYIDEQEELFEEWHIKANEIFLEKRSELIKLIGG